MRPNQFYPVFAEMKHSEHPPKCPDGNLVLHQGLKIKSKSWVGKIQKKKKFIGASCFSTFF